MRNDSMRQSMRFTEPPAVAGFGCVAGKKEREGPLYDSFDLTGEDTRFGEPTWEKAETKMQQLALQTALNKAAMTKQELSLAFSGDLLNQCIGSSFCLRGRESPPWACTEPAPPWPRDCCLRR